MNHLERRPHHRVLGWGGEHCFLAVIQETTQQFAVGRLVLRIASQKADSLEEMLVVGGFHGSVLVVEAFYLIRKQPPQERHIHSRFTARVVSDLSAPLEQRAEKD